MPVILVVDDIEGVHEMLDIVFEETEFSLLHAMSASQGVDQFRGHEVDMLLTDIQMPGGDGLRMLAELRQIDRDLVAIITTASDSREFVVQALRLGAFDFVQKPYDEDELLQTVRRAYSEVERRRELREAGGADLLDELQRLKGIIAGHEAALQAASCKDAEIERLQQELQMREERDLELRKRQLDIEAREGAMKTMENVIQQRLNQLSEQSSSGGGGGMSFEEQQELEVLKEQLEAREKEIELRENALMEREENLMMNEESLMEKGQRLIEVETELEQLREDLGGGGGGRAEGGLTEEQIEQFTAMQEEIQRKEEALLEMEERIAERERALKKSEMLIRAREQYLSQTETILFGEGQPGSDSDS